MNGSTDFSSTIAVGSSSDTIASPGSYTETAAGSVAVAADGGHVFASNILTITAKTAGAAGNSKHVILKGDSLTASGGTLTGDATDVSWDSSSNTLTVHYVPDSTQFSTIVSAIDGNASADLDASVSGSDSNKISGTGDTTISLSGGLDYVINQGTFAIAGKEFTLTSEGPVSTTTLAKLPTTALRFTLT